MPASFKNRRSSRQHLPLTPSVTTVRRGSHSTVVATETEVPQPVAASPVVGLSLISSARGVRLSRNR